MPFWGIPYGVRRCLRLARPRRSLRVLIVVAVSNPAAKTVQAIRAGDGVSSYSPFELFARPCDTNFGSTPVHRGGKLRQFSVHRLRRSLSRKLPSLNPPRICNSGQGLPRTQIKHGKRIILLDDADSALRSCQLHRRSSRRICGAASAGTASRSPPYGVPSQPTSSPLPSRKRVVCCENDCGDLQPGGAL